MYFCDCMAKVYVYRIQDFAYQRHYLLRGEICPSVHVWFSPHAEIDLGYSASVVDGMKNSLRDGEVLTYSYCDFRSDQSTNAPEVMRSPLSRLLHQCSSHVTDPGDLMDEHTKEKGGRVSVSARKFARYVSRTAKHFGRQPFLVLDALDECKDI